jgi:hypothetical protein
MCVDDDDDNEALLSCFILFGGWQPLYEACQAMAWAKLIVLI